MRTSLKVFSFANLFRFSVFVFLLAGIFISSQQVFGQSTRGTVRGTVTDQNGAIVPNATVKLVDATKGTAGRSIQTNEDGVYQFIEVEPSTYNLIVTAPNFSEFKLVEVKVEPNRNLLLDAVLSVGQVTDQVTVTAGAELIDRESPALGTTVENRRVEGLPLNGRNVLNLALLQPGVTPADTINGGSSFGSGLGIRVNGSRGVENNVTLDGANNNEVAVGSTIGGQPRPDAVQEFRLLTSNFEAEFGRNTGSVINVVTKSGSNEFHGNGRFFYRPTKLSAARFLDKALATDPNADLRRKFERKEFGGNIGGPIYFLNFGDNGGPVVYNGKDRSFFFVDYERRWQDEGASQTITGLPSLAQRMGDFSDLGTPLIDPLTGNPFPNNIIPADRISPIARYYFNFFPETNAQGQAQVSANQLQIRNYLTMRFDHNITQNHILNFTFNYFDSETDFPFANVAPASSVPGFGTVDLSKTRNYVGRYTYIVNPNLVNYLLLSYSKNKQPGVAPVNTTTPEEIGFTADFVADRRFAGPPGIQFFDSNLILGNSIQGPQSRVTENLQIQDSISYIMGSHRFKFGIDATKYKQEQDFLFINQGIFIYSAEGLQGFTNTTGNEFADFLTGQSPAAIQFGAAGLRDYRQLAFSGFAQDTWRVSKSLALSLGLRYEYVSPIKDLLDRVAYYREGAVSSLLTSGQLTNENGIPIVVPAGGRAPRGLVFVGDPDPVLGGTVPRSGVAPDKNNWAPRFGFAYSFKGGDSGFFNKILGQNRTVIRGGLGLFFGAIIGDTALQQLSAPGFNGTNFFAFPASGTLADPFAPDPFGNPNLPQISNPFAASQFELSAPLNQFSQPIDPNLKTPQVTQFNLTYERGFGEDYVIGLSYVGNRGRKLYVREQINPSLGTFFPASLRPEPVPAPTTGNTNSRRRNNDIPQGLTLLTAGGNSNYDAFEANFQKRFSDNGLLFQLAYTFSKSINDSDTQRGQLDLLDRSFGRGLSADDVPHRFVGSFIYELPFFKGSTGFAKRALDGWSLGGIYTYQSGNVFSVLNPVDTTGAGTSLISFADLRNPYQQVDPQQNDRRAFNADAFRAFSCGTNFNNTTECGSNGFRRGTAGRNQFRLNNPINNFDFILAKKLQLFSERNNLELRFEAFNLFNTTQFTTVDTNLGSVANPNESFGKYTNTREARILQLGIKLNF